MRETAGRFSAGTSEEEVSKNEVLLDAGYLDDGVIAATLERRVSMLCPDRQAPGVVKEGNVFPKSTLVFDRSTNSNPVIGRLKRGF